MPRLTIVVHPDLAGGDVGRRLAYICEDVDAIFAKNTSRRFALGRVVVSDTLDFEALSSHSFYPDHVVIQMSPHGSGGTTCRRGDVRYISNSCTNPRGLKVNRIEDPAAEDFDVKAYSKHVGAISHELAHIYGAGIGEYYSLARIPDRTGVPPSLATGPIYDGGYFDASFVRDPLLWLHPYSFRTIRTREDVVNWYRFLDRSAAVISGKRGHADPMQTSVIVTTPSIVRAWAVWYAAGYDVGEWNLIYEEKVDRETVIPWDGKFQRKRLCLWVKAEPLNPVHRPSGAMYTMFDCQADYILHGRAAPRIELACERYLAGDVDRDGVVSRDDAMRVLRHVVGIESLDELGSLLADASGNGRVTAFDAAKILVTAARS